MFNRAAARRKKAEERIQWFDAIVNNLTIVNRRLILRWLGDVVTRYEIECREDKSLRTDGRNRKDAFITKLGELSAVMPEDESKVERSDKLNFIQKLAHIYDFYCEKKRNHEKGRLLNLLNIVLTDIQNTFDPFIIGPQLAQINEYYSQKLNQELDELTGQMSIEEIQQLWDEAKQKVLDTKVIDEFCRPHRKVEEEPTVEIKLVTNLRL